MTKVIGILSIILFFLAALLLGWAYLPLPEATQTISYSPLDMRLTLEDERSQAVPEWRKMDLTIPSLIRLGDEVRIGLAFGLAEAVKGQVLPADIFDTHNVVFEAQVEVNGAGILPTGAISQPLARGEPLTFEWRIRPLGGGQVTGRVWIRLRFIPKNGGLPVERALSVVPITLQSTSFLGLQAQTARLLGWILLILAVILVIPSLDDAWKRLTPRL